jgi:hypothetical protein
VSAVIISFDGDRPSLAQVWLIVSARNPPLDDYLEDPEKLCRLISNQEAEFLDQPADPIPDYDGYAVPTDQSNAVSEAFLEDLKRLNARRFEGPPAGFVWFCDQQDYVAAAIIRSDETRPLREAIDVSKKFAVILLSVPLVGLLIGLFLFWTPFRRGA